MFRWLKNRREKKERRKPDKRCRIVNSLKSSHTSGSCADYEIYKDDFVFNRVAENKQRDYEEMDQISVLSLQFSRIIGSDFRFDTSQDIAELPARNFSGITRSVSVSECSEVPNEERFRKRTVSLPSLESSKTDFHVISNADEKTLYNEPWDCKSNLIVQYDTENVYLRLYKRVEKDTGEKVPDSRWSRFSLESKKRSEIEDRDTGRESEISQTGSAYSVFTEADRNVSNVREIPINETGSSYSVFTEADRNVLNARGLPITSQSSNSDSDEAICSDFSNEFCDGLSDSDEEHKIQLLRSLGKSENTVSSISLFRFNKHPRSRYAKIYEDSELFLIPKRFTKENKIRHLIYSQTECEYSMFKEEAIDVTNTRRKENKIRHLIYSQTECEYSMFKEEAIDVTNTRRKEISSPSSTLDGDVDKATDSDASSGFCDMLSENDEEQKTQFLKSFSNSKDIISTLSELKTLKPSYVLSRHRNNALYTSRNFLIKELRNDWIIFFLYDLNAGHIIYNSMLFSSY